MDTTYDLAAIGAGSAGMAAARRAAAAGLRVAVIDPGPAGGTCVNAGCVPKKLLVHAARVADALHEMPRLGWSASETAFSWPTVRDAVKGLSRGHAEKMRAAGVTLFDGRARLRDAGTVEVEGHGPLRARHVLIATGAAPALPDMPGVDLCITSDDLFLLPELPERIAIVGGGYIAVEFASMLSRFKVQVTLLERGDRLVAPFDAEVAELLRASLAGQGVHVRLGAAVAGIRRDDDGLRLVGAGMPENAFGAVLMAVGRRPATTGLGLEEAGVDLTEGGAVAVDDAGRTSLPGVLAAGDVAERIALTPVAVRGARRVVDIITGASDPLPRPENVPTAAYTTPECAAVGMGEAQAQTAGLAFDVRRTRFRLSRLGSGHGIR